MKALFVLAALLAVAVSISASDNFTGTFDVATAQTTEEAEWLRLYAETGTFDVATAQTTEEAEWLSLYAETEPMCTEPEDIHYSTDNNFTGTQANIDDTVVYTCNNGFEALSTCLADGTWSHAECSPVLETCTVNEMDTGRPSDNQGQRYGESCYYPTQSPATISETISYCRDEPYPDNANFTGTFDVATAQTAEEAEWLRHYVETVMQSNMWWMFLICESGEWVDASTGEAARFLRPNLTAGGTCTEGYCGVLMADDDVWVEKRCDRPQDILKGFCKIRF